MTGLDSRKRWLILYILCAGVLMIVLDGTIVNVALPSIKADLGFSNTGLVWVVNGYLLTFGGFLLLGGRLGDFYGHRLLFLAGLAVFTVASLACGLATSQWMLVAARAVQGIGGAVVDAVALSLIMTLFPEAGERAKAMGFYGFVCASGGSIGAVAGGLITGSFSWHWNFLVNVPIGAAVFALCWWLVPKAERAALVGRFDVAGAITITAALMLAVYAIVGGNEAGWLSVTTLGFLAAAVALLALFLLVEARTENPIMPLRMFKLVSISASNVVAVLWAAAMFAWFFISALYMQLVLHYTPTEIGFAFVPSNVIMAILSLGISAKLVTRFGARPPLVTGLAAASLGLFLFAFAPVDGSYWLHILPGMALSGIGAGIAFNPLLIVAMRDAGPDEQGVASGMVNTAFMMGGALGLAILASFAAARTASLTGAGAELPAALTGGYSLAFILGGVFAGLAALLSWIFLEVKPGATLSPSPH